jgi:hypothetical protein
MLGKLSLKCQPKLSQKHVPKLSQKCLLKLSQQHMPKLSKKCLLEAVLKMSAEAV